MFRPVMVRLLGACAALSCCAVALPARATVMQELTLDELVGTADAVVRGVVVRTGTRVTVVGEGLEPRTHTWIAVSEWISGGAESRLVEVWEPGGTYGDVQVTTEGSPRYQVGEEVVALLRADPTRPGLYRTHEMAQGKFHVIPPSEIDGRTASIDPAARRVRRELDDVVFAAWTRDQLELRPARPAPTEDLTTLLARMRSLAAAKKLRAPALPNAAGGKVTR